MRAIPRSPPSENRCLPCSHGGGRAEREIPMYDRPGIFVYNVTSSEEEQYLSTRSMRGFTPTHWMAAERIN